MLKDRLQNILESASNFQINFTGDLTEADFNDEKRLVSMTVLKEGTSKNGIHYTKKSLSQVKGFLETTAKKVYIDHPEDGKVKASRPLSEWIGNVEGAFIKESANGNSLRANVSIHSDGPNAWTYNRMKENMGEFGPSIIGKAIIKQQKIDGKKLNVAEDIVYLKSFDIVDSPSAGGSVDAILESTIWKDGEENGLSEALKDRLSSLKQRKKERELSENLWEIKWAFNTLVQDIVMAKEEFEDVSVEKRKTELGTAFTETLNMVNTLEFVKPSKKKTKESTDITEGITKEDFSVEVKNVGQMKDTFPEFTAQLMTEAVETFKKEQKIEEKVGKAESLQKDLDTSNKELGELKESNKTLTEDNVKYKENEKKVLEQKLINRKVGLVDKVKGDLKFDKEASSELFESELSACELVEDAEQKFIDKITEKIKDRMELIGKKIKVKPTIEGTGLPVKPCEVVKETDEGVSALASAVNVKLNK